MAKLIQAVIAYGPKLKLDRTASMNEVINMISGRTGLNAGDVSHMVNEFKAVILTFALAGRPVNIEGLGIFRPKIDLRGTIALGTRFSPQIKASLNKTKAYEGVIENRDMIGTTSEDLISKWNEDHPDDLIS